MKKAFLILLCTSLFLSELSININRTLGFFIYILMITGCLLALSKKEDLDDYGKLIIIFMILPMIRVIESFIILEEFWKILIIYYAFLFFAVFYSVKFKIDHGYTKKMLYLLPFVIILGIGFGVYGDFLFEFNKYPEIFFLIPVIAYTEEVFFRGMMQNTIMKDYDAVSSVFFTALLYSIFSISVGFPAVLFIFFVSLIVGLIYNFSRNIFLTIPINLIIHFFYLL